MPKNNMANVGLRGEGARFDGVRATLERDSLVLCRLGAVKLPTGGAHQQVHGIVCGLPVLCA
jgi:hypothetical protein